MSPLRLPAALLLISWQLASAGLDVPALEKVETQIQAVADKAMPSVVALSIQKPGKPPGHGTGFIVSKDGLILTAGHMVEGGVETFGVTFLDGRKAQAKVLGADYEDDVALAQITDLPGPFPFLELRDTKDLTPGEMVISLGHTSGMDLARKAPARWGRFFEFSPKGDLRSDCLMAGGDSGGPLFDLQGKVIGVHSQIESGMTQNFDVPAGTALKQWDRMLKGERWGTNRVSTLPKVAAKPLTDEELAGMDLKQLFQHVSETSQKNNGRISMSPPVIAQWYRDSGMKEERVKAMADKDLIAIFQKALSGSETLAYQPSRKGASAPVPAITQQDTEILAAIKPALEKLVPSIVSLTDDSKQPLALGTIVRADGFILTKHSEIAKATGPLKVRFSDGRELPATPVREFQEHDLALVKVAADSLPAVTFPDRQQPLPIGNFVFTPGTQPTTPLLKRGIVGVPSRIIPGPGAFLGTGLEEATDCVQLTDVKPDSPAAKGGLQKGDQILSIEGRTFQKTQQLSQYIFSLKPGARIQVKYRRTGEEKSVEVQLERPPFVPKPKDKASEIHTLGTSVSDIQKGFPLAFQTDQTLRPQDCGSLLIDLHGEIIGLNIARAGRTHSYAIPTEAIAAALKTVDFDTLAK